MLRATLLILSWQLIEVTMTALVAGADTPEPSVRRDARLEKMPASCQVLADRGDPALARRPLPDWGRTDFTALAWLRTTGDGTILAKCPERGNWVPQGKSLFVRQGQVVFDIGWVGCLTSQRRVDDGQWHHVALVCQGDRQQLFVDGRPEARGSLRREADDARWVLKFGRTANDFGGDLRGALDEVRLYTGALTEAEIRRQFEQPSATADQGLAGAWPFEGDGRDASGGGHPAAIAGQHAFVPGRLGQAWQLSGQGAAIPSEPADPALETLAAQELAGLRAIVHSLRTSAGDATPADNELLGRLQQLEQQGTDLAGRSADLTRWAEEVAALRREILVANYPATGFDKLVFVKRLTYSSNHYYTEYINAEWTPGGNLCVLDLRSGSVQELVPQLRGGVFERFDVSFDARRIVFAWKAGPQVGYRIYEVQADGTGLRQLTFPPPDEAELVQRYRVFPHYHHGTDDMQPCYLPDGGIAFISTRCQYGILCDSPDDFTTTVLYRMDSDGGNLRKLTNSSVSEASPVMLPDGRILYTRWEYVDKGAVSVKCLWAMHPDGTASSEIYGNDIALPPTLIYGRPIPQTPNKYVVLGTPHCPQNGVGTVIRLDMSQDIRSRDPMTYMTPDVDIQAEPGFAFRRSGGPWTNDSQGTGRLFKDPYPLAEDLFVVAHKPEGAAWNAPAGYGLYLLDAQGRTHLIYRDPAISCWLPYPLKPRTVPRVLPSERQAELAEKHQALCVVSDVYRGLKDVPRGTIKYIRVLEQIPRPWAARRSWPGDEYDQQHACITKDTHLGLKVQHGVVPVEADGSAAFLVPAEANIFLQVLDADYLAVQTERTYVNYMPGEVRSCVGCHETPNQTASGASRAVVALRRPPSVPGPQPGETSGRRALDYAHDVQPVWDRHCLECHSGSKLEGGLDLSGTLTAMFNVSYEALVPERRKARFDRGLLGPVIGENHPKTGNVAYLPARSLGSHASVLIAMLLPDRVQLADAAQAARVRKLRDSHQQLKLAPEELLRVTNWVDTNCQFYGTYWGRKNLKYRDHPQFRPVPTFEMASRLTQPWP